MPSTTTYRCKACQNGPCYYCTKDSSTTDVFGASLGDNLPIYCPLCSEMEATPRWNMTVSPSQRGGYKWLVENLTEWVDDHYDEVPQFIRDAAYGQLIQPQRASYLKEIDLLRLMADMAESYVYGEYEEKDRIKKAIDKAKKIDLINDLIPAAFAAGTIYAYIRLHSNELDGMEDVGDID